MNRIARKLTAALLALCLCASLTLPAAAADAADPDVLKAEALGVMGLFQGSDQGYELDRAPTRIEAVIMLIRLLGQENEALYSDGGYTHPFVDAPGWEGASDYLAYAYSTGLTTGADSTHFDPESTASAQMFATFVLRALGYEDGEQGSVWDNWQNLLENGVNVPADVDLSNFLRGDMVSLCYAALDAQVQGAGMTLAEKLVEDGRVSDLALRIGRAITGKAVTADSPLADIMAYLYASVRDSVSIRYMNETEMTPDNVKGFLGTDEVEFTEGLAVEPLMTAQAHSVCLLRLPEGADVETAKQLIRENVNPRKWICVGVDESNVYVESIDNLVLLAMDNNCGAGIAAAFRALDGSLPRPDANGMIKLGDTYIEDPAEMDRDSIVTFAEKMIALRDENFAENNVYLSVIPDKSYYARGEIANYLNHESMTAALREWLYDWNVVELSGALTLSDYYKTDPHWDQPDILDVVDLLGETMGFSIDHSAFTAESYDGFVGSYGRLVQDIEPETITWLRSDYTDAATVDNMQTPDGTMVYNTGLLDSDTAYNVFLSGLSPLTVIESPESERDRHLVLISDSYGSSLAPLLLEQYSRVTVVDLRFMPSSLLPQYVDFENADVLMLFGAAVVNNSSILK